MSCNHTLRIRQQFLYHNVYFVVIQMDTRKIRAYIKECVKKSDRLGLTSTDFTYWNFPIGFRRDKDQIPRSFQISSTRVCTTGSIMIGVPHVRVVSPGHLLVASRPIFPPSPDTGLAKSR